MAFCQRHVAERMATWTELGFLDQNLNHRNYGRSVLKNIAGLDDSCLDVKRALMRAVVGELDRVRRTPPAAALDALIPSLGDVLFEDAAYLRGHRTFTAWLCAGLLGDGSTPPKIGDAAQKALVRLVARSQREEVGRPNPDTP